MAENPTSHSSVHIIVNPIAGHGGAPKFVENYVLPLLADVGIPYEIHHTTGVRDAGRIGRSILSTSTETERTVIIAGGDGTAHEMIEGNLEAVREGKKLGRWELVVLPLGTANALFSSLFAPPAKSPPNIPANIRIFLDTASSGSDTVYNLSPRYNASSIYHLSSLITSLSGRTKPRRLPITLTSLLPSTSSTRPAPDPIPSHIVLSTSLHAALLSTSESLRSEHPGIERFKLAAEANLGIFFQANVRLVPPRNGRVMQYDPHTQNWAKPFTSTYTYPDGDVKLDGPFTYLLSTTTTPRLEPTFVISPLLATLPPSEADPPSMDVVILRPLRDPRVRSKRTEAEQGEIWKTRAREVLGWAYMEGGHVDLTYPVKGDKDAEVRGEGEVVVETFRCGGFEWTPSDELHDPSHIVCADGSLHTISKGGMVRVGIMDTGTRGADEGFYVWG